MCKFPRPSFIQTATAHLRVALLDRVSGKVLNRFTWIFSLDEYTQQSAESHLVNLYSNYLVCVTGRGGGPFQSVEFPSPDAKHYRKP